MLRYNLLQLYTLFVILIALSYILSHVAIVIDNYILLIISLVSICLFIILSIIININLI